MDSAAKTTSTKNPCQPSGAYFMKMSDATMRIPRNAQATCLILLLTCEICLCFSKFVCFSKHTNLLNIKRHYEISPKSLELCLDDTFCFVFRWFLMCGSNHSMVSQHVQVFLLVYSYKYPLCVLYWLSYYFLYIIFIG